MKYVGLDLSLTATGLVLVNEHGDAVSHALIATRAERSRSFDDQERIDYIVKMLLAYLDEYERMRGFRLRIAIEGHAFGARRSDTRVHEVGGVVKLELYRRGMPFTLYSSGTIKKFATGNGRASKQEMVAAALAAGFAAGTNHNLADAFHVARWHHARHQPLSA